MVNQYYVIHVAMSSFIMDIFNEGKIEETDKQPKRSEPTLVRLQISQESDNHGSANTKISFKQLKP
jgi:hypothetical protein